MISRIALAAPMLAACFLASCKSRPPVPATPPPDLEGAVIANAQTVGPSELLGSIQKSVTHQTDESVTMQVNLEMGKCYVFSAAADTSTVEELKFYLFNPAGQRMATAEGHGKTLTSFCVTGQLVVNMIAGGWGGGSVGNAMPGLYKVELKTTEGAGHVFFGTFVQPGGK